MGENEARCVRKKGHIAPCFFAVFVSVGDYACGGLHYDPKMYMIEKKLQEDLQIMKLLIQRVREASVEVDGEITGRVGHGFLVFVGVAEADTTAIADKMIDKMVKLRIFEDENGKTNKSIADVGGNFLVVSQFTLYADCRKGNRPSFTNAGNPQLANELYEYVLASLRDRGFEVGAGVFGADMKVSLLNDGPFTVMLDSEEICR